MSRVVGLHVAIVLTIQCLYNELQFADLAAGLSTRAEPRTFDKSGPE